MADTMPIREFATKVLLNRTLREGPFIGPRVYGSDTALYKSLSLLSPKQMPDGSWKGDALYFFATPVHEPLALLQNTLRDLSRQYGLAPNPGEHLVNSYISRIIDAITAAKKTELQSDTIELTPQNMVLITPLDAPGLRAMMLSMFGIGDDDVERRDEVLARVGQLVFEGFITEAYELISESDQEKLEKLIETTEDPNEVIEFLERRLPNFDSLLAKQVVRVKKDYEDLTRDFD